MASVERMVPWVKPVIYLLYSKRFVSCFSFLHAEMFSKKRKQIASKIGFFIAYFFFCSCEKSK